MNLLMKLVYRLASFVFGACDGRIRISRGGFLVRSFGIDWKSTCAVSGLAVCFRVLSLSLSLAQVMSVSSLSVDIDM